MESLPRGVGDRDEQGAFLPLEKVPVSEAGKYVSQDDRGRQMKCMLWRTTLNFLSSLIHKLKGVCCFVLI